MSVTKRKVKDRSISNGFTQHHFISSEKKSGDGFTLIEGIIATGIISSALIVGLALAISNLNAAQANSDRILASHLAREGLEVVRNIRDSNWLRRDRNIDKEEFAGDLEFYAWDDYFDNWPAYSDAVCGSSKCYGNYYDIFLNDVSFPQTEHNYTLHFVPDAADKDLPICIAAANQPACRIQLKEGVYFQAAAVDPSAEQTRFYRRVELVPICRDASNNVIVEEVIDQGNQDLDCNAGPDFKIGVLVTSRVMWRKGSQTREVSVKERLYNWRNL